MGVMSHAGNEPQGHKKRELVVLFLDGAWLSIKTQNGLFSRINNDDSVAFMGVMSHAGNEHQGFTKREFVVSGFNY